MWLHYFLPEILLIVGIVATLIMAALDRPGATSKLSDEVLLFFTLCLGGTCIATLGLGGVFFYGSYKVDLLSQGLKLLISLALALTCAIGHCQRAQTNKHGYEHYFFLFSSALGMLMVCSCANLPSLYVALELSSYGLYILSALKKDASSAEASTKYIIFGAAASGVLLWGMSLIAGLSGSMDLTTIATHLQHSMTSPIMIIALIMTLSALLFKLSAFPFHFWAPDTYQCSPTNVTTFIATASKVTAVAFLIRLLSLFTLSADLVFILGVLSFASMTLGNCAALRQHKVKRLLAYSSVAQAGYILLGVLSGSIAGYASVFFYIVAYVLMNAGAFLVLACVNQDQANDDCSLDDFNGLWHRAPFLALLLLLSLLSLAGIPPLAGFTGKWIMFSAAMQTGHWFLVVWAVLNSVVSLYYYLALVRHAYLEKPKTDGVMTLSLQTKLLALGLLIAIIGIGAFPNFLVSFSHQAMLSFLS